MPVEGHIERFCSIMRGSGYRPGSRDRAPSGVARAWRAEAYSRHLGVSWLFGQQRGRGVAISRNYPHREPEAFAPDMRPGADAYVYCKGCGAPLEERSRLSKPRAVVDVMMCEACQEKHGHCLMPVSGAPTYCYRCGTLEEVFVEPGQSPITRHVCPRCLPDRVARYRAGDFEEPHEPRVEAPVVEKEA